MQMCMRMQDTKNADVSRRDIARDPDERWGIVGTLMVVARGREKLSPRFGPLERPKGRYGKHKPLGRGYVSKGPHPRKEHGGVEVEVVEGVGMDMLDTAEIGNEAAVQR